MGTGRLTVASLLMDAAHVIGTDIDMRALNQSRDNLNEYFDEEWDGGSCDLVLADVTTRCLARGGRRREELQVDTVVMNPPFGTRNKGVDVKFLEVAFTVGFVISPRGTK